MTGFAYFECPDCQFDCILLADFPSELVCPLCAEDSGHVVKLRRGEVPEGCEHVEGFDARPQKTSKSFSR